MTGKRKILAISGSTRQRSANLDLIHIIGRLFSNVLDVQYFNGLEALPHFNPDLDTDSPPQPVMDFRRRLKAVEGILICTPEYAMVVPGTLKNVIDWTVSSCEFSNKPVALITASSSGQKGHAALMETLKVIEAAIPEDSQLIIPFVKTKIQGERITDTYTLEQVKRVINSLILIIGRR